MTRAEIEALNLDPDKTPVFAISVKRLPCGGGRFISQFVGYDDGKGNAASGVLRFSFNSPKEKAA